MAHRPKRSLGQNFLVDPGYRARIVEAVRVGAGETVLEIGPGRGAITEGLARAVEVADGRLVLVELDDALAASLAERYRDAPGVHVIHGDVLDHSITDLAAGADRESLRASDLKVVGNIPYNITTPILFHLLERPRPREILLMVQREVADRILAAPGGKEYGALSVGVRTVAAVERVFQVPSGAFRPRPKVDSTVIRITPDPTPSLSESEEARLRVLVRAVFQWRRKQLGKILREHPDLAGPGIVARPAGHGSSPRARWAPGAVRDPSLAERLLAAAGVRAEQRPEEVAPTGFAAMARVLADEAV